MTTIRTRFAPSPTGYLHIGSLRTALYAYLFARQNNGDFILRVEDTDQSREIEGAVQHLIQTLENMGIDYDEGPTKDGEKGPHSPYYQSQRLDIYKKYVDQLVLDGKAYYSFKTTKEIDKIKKNLANKPPFFSSESAGGAINPLRREHFNEHYTPDELNTKIEQGEEYVIRLEMPTSGRSEFIDLVRGKLSIEYATMDDFILMKSDGFPTYNFANVIDDYEMNITHVIRGEEFIPSMPKHLYLYEALGFEKPEFAHLPLILNPDKTKLSKRQGDVSVEDFLDKGYLPQTLINFVALLGWNEGDGITEEFYTLDELVKAFSFQKVHKGGAILDTTKLDWMNGKYLREKITIEEFLNLIFEELKESLDKYKCGIQYLEDKNKLNYFAQLIRARIDRINQVADFFSENQWLDEPATYKKELLTWKKSTFEDALEKLTELHAEITTLTDDNFNSVESIEKVLKIWIESKEYGNGDVLWPMRVALTGQERSPNPFEIAYLVGREETLRRIQIAIDK